MLQCILHCAKKTYTISVSQCSGEAFLTCAHLYLPLLSTILHENMTASPSLKYANLMHLWCRSACFNLFWDLNKRVFYYMVQQTPFQSWTSILVHSWLVTDKISIASCILVLVTCDTRRRIQNRGELLQRSQASYTSEHALGIEPWTLGLPPHSFPQNKLFLHQDLKKMCTHYLHYKLFDTSSEVNFDLYKVMQASEQCKHTLGNFCHINKSRFLPFFVLQQQHCIWLIQFKVYRVLWKTCTSDIFIFLIYLM